MREQRATFIRDRGRRRSPKVCNLRIVETEPLIASSAHLALRTLARMMLRRYQNGDPLANVTENRQPSSLTLVPRQSAHYGDEGA